MRRNGSILSQSDHLLGVPGLFSQQDGAPAAARRGRFRGAGHHEPAAAASAPRLVQGLPLLRVALGRLPSGGVVAVRPRHPGAQRGDGEERVGAVRGVGEREAVQRHLGAAQALVVLEAALLLPQHDDE